MPTCFSPSARFRARFLPFPGRLLRVGVTAIVALSALGPAIGGNAVAAGENPSKKNPVLESFGLSASDLPKDVYLVRTRGELPPLAGIVVHAARGGVFVVSGEGDAVLALAQHGCAVVPVPASRAEPRTPGRVWKPLDAADPAITAMVDEVDWTGVSAKIQWLVDFGTRYSFASNRFTVADAIGDAFAGYGLTTVLRPFVYRTVTMWNVEATQLGTVYPDSFVVICGHFDTTSDAAATNAPGADDNGTGAAAVLTAAEILSQHDFEYSIRYLCFAGEEQGLQGSEAYAAWADAQNLGIVGVLNFDMIGYWKTGVPKDLEIETNQASQWLAAAIVNAANLYTTAPYELHVYDGAWWGDHASFWNHGYAAVNHEEAWDWCDPDFNPYYHMIGDLLAHVDPDFTVGNVRVGVASLAVLAGYVPEGTGIGGTGAPALEAGALSAYPNPFGSRVTFSVSGLGGRTRASIVIFDAAGRLVRELPVDVEAGTGTATWWTADDGAPRIGAGVYFAKVDGIRGARPVKIVHIK